MRYPYARARNFFTRELKKEERKLIWFISASEKILQQLEATVRRTKPNKPVSRSVMNDIEVTRNGILRATEELESVRRNMEAISHL